MRTSIWRSPISEIWGGDHQTCEALVECIDVCVTTACRSACIRMGDASARGKLAALEACVDATCPATTAVDGGAHLGCDVDGAGALVDEATCRACVHDAQSPGRPCAAAATDCFLDGA